MTQGIINNGESGATVRGKLNSNFTELYGSLAAYPTLKSGNWINPHTGVVPAPFAPPALTISLLPFLIHKPTTIVGLGLGVEDGVFIDTARLGLYASDIYGSPSGAPVATTATISDFTNFQIITGSVSEVTLTPGVYWGAVSVNAGINQYIMSQASQIGLGLSLGAPDINLLSPTNEFNALLLSGTSLASWPTLDEMSSFDPVSQGPLIGFLID